MKIFFSLLCSTLLGLAGFSPNTTTTLTGTVTDADTKEPLIGATVKVTKNHALIKGTVTDVKGSYQLALSPDTYEVEFSYTGYTAQRIIEVQVKENQTNVLNSSLSAGASLEECVVLAYREPLIRTDDISTGTTISAKRLVGRSEAASSTRDARKKDGSHAAPLGKAAGKVAPALRRASVPGDVKIKGAHTTTTDYYSGIPVKSPPPATDTEADKTVATPAEKEYAEESMPDADEPSSGTPAEPAPHAGLLTAGEWNDLHNWNTHWIDLLADGEIDAYETMYNFYPKSRYTILLTNEQDFPLADLPVKLLTTSGEVIWEARTDNTGKAELWSGLFDKKERSDLSVVAWMNGQKRDLGTPKSAKNGLNRYQIANDCQAPKNVDIVWAVDATGSMGDEIEYLKTELLDVIGQAKSHNPELAFRMGTVFYRDQGDDYITKSSGLSPDITKTVDFIRKQFAGGGGDYPEAVHSALEEAIFNQKWQENAIARICFLVLDASPHQSAEVNASLQRSIREAARLGIRIVPVTASGIQKDTEFLMKFFGLATNGTYVFLTDHSGIGGKHIEPTSDEYKVELLNDLLVRLITEYTTIKTCSGQSTIRFEKDPQQPNANQPQAAVEWQAFYYPNPASTQFTLDLPFEVQSVTIYNAEGKAVRKLEKPQAGVNTVLVGDLAPGFYTIRILKDGRMQSGKLMVVRN